MPLQNFTAMLCLGHADVSLCPPPHLESSSSPCSNRISVLFLHVRDCHKTRSVVVSRVGNGGFQRDTKSSRQSAAIFKEMLVPTACSLGKEEIWQLLLISKESSWSRRHKAAQQSPGSPTTSCMDKESNEKSGKLLSTVVFQVSATNTIQYSTL